MFRVKNLSAGRVQIRSRGRATNGGETEVVQVIDPRLIRLRGAGLVSWEQIKADVAVKPAAVAVVKAPPPAPPKPPETKKAEVIEVAKEEPVEEPAEEPVEEAAEEPAEEPAEEAGEPEDQRITFERERLSASSWNDVKAEAKDNGIKGRSRDTIESRLLDLFESKLK
jgi:outer membrane biosynthesis protein TonB